MSFDLRGLMNADLLSEYKAAQPEMLAWWENPAHEKTKFGVEASTIRALSTGARGKDGPLALFEAWAFARLREIKRDSGRWIVLNTREGFDAWHAELTGSLVSHWEGKVRELNARRRESEPSDVFSPANPTLSIAHRYKLIDLFVRSIRLLGSDFKQLTDSAFRFGHIPLDRKSFAVIDACYNGIGLGGPFSMGNLTSEAAYRTYQKLASALCEHAGGTPLLLDVFAWQSPVAQALYES